MLLTSPIWWLNRTTRTMFLSISHYSPSTFRFSSPPLFPFHLHYIPCPALLFLRPHLFFLLNCCCFFSTIFPSLSILPIFSRAFFFSSLVSPLIPLLTFPHVSFPPPCSIHNSHLPTEQAGWTIQTRAPKAILTSTAKLNHSCVYRKLQRCAINCARVWACVNGFVILAEVLYVGILGLLLLATASLRGQLFGWTSGDRSQKVWDRIGQWPPHSGGRGSLCLKMSMMMGGGKLVRAPVLNILWHFHSSWVKSREASGLSTCSFIPGGPRSNLGHDTDCLDWGLFIFLSPSKTTLGLFYPYM